MCTSPHAHTQTHTHNYAHSNANVIPYHKLEHHVRAHLDATSPRALAVLRPLRVVITNVPEGHCEGVAALHFPGRADSGYTVRMDQLTCACAARFRIDFLKQPHCARPCHAHVQFIK